MVYYHKLSLAKAMDSIKDVFGCWHWSMELGIGIWCHQCRRLDVERIENWNCEQIPCGIRVYCTYVPPIQRLDPRYHEGFGPQLPRPLPRRKRIPIASSISPPCGRRRQPALAFSLAGRHPPSASPAATALHLHLRRRPPSPSRPAPSICISGRGPPSPSPAGIVLLPRQRASSSLTGGCLHAEPQGRCISSSHSRSSPVPHIRGPGPEAEAGWSWTHGVWRSPELGTKRKQHEQWLEFLQMTKFHCHSFVHPNRNWI